MGVSLAQFIENLIQSGVMTGAEVEAFQAGLPAAERPRTAEALAEQLIQAGRLTKYQAACVYQGKSKGLVLGEYTVLDKLGQGGMGVVLKAQHRRMKRLVAIKVLRAATMKNPEAVRRFYREAQAAARLSHPNIVTAYDAGEHGGIHYLVMEYVDGQDLATLVRRRGPLPVSEAVGYVLQAARGLQYAHEQGVVHRDIKPGNLLLDKGGTVKILDMGLARLQTQLGSLQDGQSERVTETGQVLGTCDYMAPEQAKDTHKADHRADIYALGCTLYRLLTGKALYERDSLVEVLLAHRDAPVPSLRDARPDVPAELDALFQQMVAKRPQDRPQSMAAVIEGLESRVGAAVGKAAAAGDTPSERALAAFIQSIVEDASGPRKPPSARETIAHRAGGETFAGADKRTVAGATRWLPIAWILGASIAGLLLGVGTIVVVLGRSEPGGETKPIAKAKGADQASKARTAPEKKQAAPAQDAQSNFPPGPAASKPEPKPKEALSKPEAPTDAKAPPEAKAPPVEERPAEAIEPPPKEPLSKPEAPPEANTPPVEAKTEPPGPLPEVEKAREAERRYAAAVEPAEKLVAAWDFRGALAALEMLRFEDQDLAARLAERREEIRRMEALKTRMIARINGADPPLKKMALGIRGLNGDIVRAEESGLTAKLFTGKTETLAWDQLGPKSLPKLLDLVVDRSSADDWVSAGMLAMANRDASLAERCLEQARNLGAGIEPYLGPLAAAAMAQAGQLLQKKAFAEAEAALSGIEAKYAKTPWFRTNKEALEAARRAAAAGKREAEADRLYAEAAQLFSDNELFDLKPIVERLKADYAGTAAATDGQRKPSLAEMEQAVANLGKRLTVRLDGKGDFTSIQAAIDAAPPESLIEIQDNGPYNEPLKIAKRGLTLRGKRGFWPIVTSSGPRSHFSNLVEVSGARLTLDRLVLAHTAPPQGDSVCLKLGGPGPVHVRNTVLNGGHYGCRSWSEVQLDKCVILRGGLSLGAAGVVKDLICVGGCSLSPSNGGRLENVLLLLDGGLSVAGQCELRRCTITQPIRIAGPGNVIFVDCILFSIESSIPDIRIEHCNVHGRTPFGNLARPGKGCFSDDPMFVAPKMLDYRLLPNSPCRGRASDGGDVGFQYTEELAQMLRFAFELRAKGVLRFDVPGER